MTITFDDAEYPVTDGAEIRLYSQSGAIRIVPREKIPEDEMPWTEIGPFAIQAVPK